MKYQNKKEKHAWKWILLLAALLLTFLVSLFLGRYLISPVRVIQILGNALTGKISGGIEESVVLNIRLPRLLLTMLVGAGMAASGAAFQGIFQNPLVSPDVLGVSFGAVIGIMISGTGPLAMALSMIAGIGSVALTYVFSKIKGQSTTLSLILAGMIVQALMNALVSLVKYTADPYSKLPQITYWLMGSFTGANYKKCAVAGLAVALGGMILCLMRWRINLLSMGDEEARSLGIHPERDRFLVILASTFITAACVTVSGIVGWVGMVIPNIVRRMIGADHCYLIPLSALAGAAFMMAADLGARSICAGEIPVGILTALAGAPLFAVVFARKDGKQK